MIQLINLRNPTISQKRGYFKVHQMITVIHENLIGVERNADEYSELHISLLRYSETWCVVNRPRDETEFDRAMV